MHFQSHLHRQAKLFLYFLNCHAFKKIPVLAEFRPNIKNIRTDLTSPASDSNYCCDFQCKFSASSITILYHEENTTGITIAIAIRTVIVGMNLATLLDTLCDCQKDQ